MYILEHEPRESHRLLRWVTLGSVVPGITFLVTLCVVAGTPVPAIPLIPILYSAITGLVFLRFKNINPRHILLSDCLAACLVVATYFPAYWALRDWSWTIQSRFVISGLIPLHYGPVAMWLNGLIHIYFAVWYNSHCYCSFGSADALVLPPLYVEKEETGEAAGSLQSRHVEAKARPARDNTDAVNNDSIYAASARAEHVSAFAEPVASEEHATAEPLLGNQHEREEAADAEFSQGQWSRIAELIEQAVEKSRVGRALGRDSEGQLRI